MAAPSDARHNIAPITFSGDAVAAWGTLKTALIGMPNLTVVEDSAGYMHIEQQTSFCGFVDDTEFLLDAAGSVINVRSASRVGRTDFGANRKRVEEVRARFARWHGGSSGSGELATAKLVSN